MRGIEDWVIKCKLFQVWNSSWISQEEWRTSVLLHGEKYSPRVKYKSFLRANSKILKNIKYKNIEKEELFFLREQAY